MYEIRSIRLILRRDENHFSRLVRCARCEREVLGPAVLTAADLDQPLHAVVCHQCVRGLTEMPRPVERAVEAKADSMPPAEEPAPPPAVEAEEPALPAAEAEAEAEPVAVVEAGPDDADAGDAPVGTGEVAETVDDDRLAGMEARLAALADAYDARIAAVEEQGRRQSARLNELLSAYARDLTSVSGAFAEVRSQLAQVADVVREAGRAQADLEAGITRLAARLDAEPDAAALAEDAQRRVHEVAGELSQAMDAQVEALHATVAAALEQSRAGTASVEAWVQGRVAAVIAAVGDLWEARDDLEARLHASGRMAGEEDARGPAPAGSGAEPGHRSSPPDVDVLGTLDQQLRDAADRLAQRTSDGL